MLQVLIKIYDSYKCPHHMSQSHHEKTCFMPYANNKGADQPAHPCSLISAFVVCSLHSKIPLLAIAEIS